ncbi:hypothetical protein [Salinispora arenicola]|nr:hypothetical protein [Salinispora arenicola]
MPPWPFGSLKSQGMTLGESEQVKDDLTRVLREAGSTRVGMTGTNLAVWARPLEGAMAQVSEDEQALMLLILADAGPQGMQPKELRQ